MLPFLDLKIRLLTVAKVANEREVREVQEGATCFCAKKLSKFDQG